MLVLLDAMFQGRAIDNNELLGDEGELAGAVFGSLHLVLFN